MIFSPKYPDRPAKIIRVAVHLFARQGYHGTSTREIARLAEISENTLFRYFEHKESLFWEALRSSMSGLKLRKQLQDCIEECAPPQIVLPQILAQLVDTAILQPELLRLIAVAFLELRGKASQVCNEHFSPIFSTVNRYLTSSMERGKLRNLDPAMVTTALAMTTMLHPEFLALINGVPPAHSDSQQAIQAYTKFWIEVLVPPTFSELQTPTWLDEVPSSQAG
ncbi:MAG: TetR/AcrR family transcriptional regulator [Terriglobia bacterium]